MTDTEIKFFHFGDHSAYSQVVEGDAYRAAYSNKISYSTHDFFEDPEIAREYNIFTPNMILLPGGVRIYTPMEEMKLKATIREGGLDSWPTYVEQQPVLRPNRIEDLSWDVIDRACWVYVKGTIDVIEVAKANWTRRIHNSTGANVFGYLAWENRGKAGALEFLPGNIIPYPIAGLDAKTAFITHLQTEEEFGDYRPSLVEHAVNNIPSLGYDSIVVVSSRTKSFPNAPMKVFTHYGFKEKAVLDTVELSDGKEELILLEYAQDL